jgi:hypothetical protein
VTYTDIAVSANYLYYTKITLNANANLGTVGVAGTAAVKSIYLNGLQRDADYAPGDIVVLLPLSQGTVSVVESLGNAYFDPSGNLVAGAWQLSRDGMDFVVQQIGGVSAKNGTVSSSLCVGSVNNGFDCSALKGAESNPIANHPTAGIDKTGAHLAFTAGTLYTQTVGNGSVAKVADLGWTTPPTWSNDGKHVAVTQFVSSSTGANGAPEVKLNIVVYDGQNAVTVVPGGQDLAWKP